MPFSLEATCVQSRPPEPQALKGSHKSYLGKSVNQRSARGHRRAPPPRVSSPGKASFAFRAALQRLAEEERLTLQVNGECRDNQHFGAICNDVSSSGTGPPDTWCLCVGRERQRDTLGDKRATKGHSSLTLQANPAKGKGLCPERPWK